MARPYNIITIDLRKAFDMVHHSSINKALERVGVSERIRKLIDNQYNNTSTLITCGNKSTGEIPIRRGVKQGDPLSPFIFNCVIDDFLTNVSNEYGVNVNGTKISTIAYADDIILLSEDIGEMQHLINGLIANFEKKGLCVNVEKCTALSSSRVPAKKKLYIETNNIFRCKDKWIPQIKVEDMFRYLGKNFCYSGISKFNVTEIILSLNNLQKAPLKPQQKLTILKNFFLPKILYSLQYPGITKKTLNIVDHNIRRIAKHFLHIPTRTSSHFLYARIKDGGLGILSMKERVPLVLYNRIKNLKNSNDPLTNATLSSTQGQRVMNKLEKMITGLESKEIIDRYHAGKLEISYSGNGLAQGNWSSISSAWVDNPPIFWKGFDYVNAIKLKCNMLPTKGIPSNPITERKCRGGCDKTESLSHVLQNCPVTHWKRINRHDRICQIIKDVARKKNFEIEVEPNIRSDDGILRKPDLILHKNGCATVIDVGVHWEGPNNLISAFANKKTKYSNPYFISTCMSKFNVLNVAVVPFIIGARGVWCIKNRELATSWK